MTSNAAKKELEKIKTIILHRASAGNQHRQDLKEQVDRIGSLAAENLNKKWTAAWDSVCRDADRIYRLWFA